MRIGLAYDLRRDYLDMGFSEEETAEFDSEATINILAETIRGLGHEVRRIGNVFSLTERLAEGERWDLVFNVTEGLSGRSREAQVPALLEAHGIPFTFSDALTLALTLDKALTKRVVRDAGVPTPDFRLIEGPSDIDALAFPPYPLFLKPNSEGTGKGVSPDSLVRDGESLRTTAIGMLDRYRQPVLAEACLPGREFTVGVLGTGRAARVIGVLEVTLLESAEPFAYSYVNKELCEENVLYRLVGDWRIVREASEIALRSHLVLGLRDAGRVDLRMDKNGSLQFLETNPLPGLHPTHSDLPMLCTRAGISYRELIGEIISSAIERIQTLSGATRRAG